MTLLCAPRMQLRCSASASWWNFMSWKMGKRHPVSAETGLELHSSKPEKQSLVKDEMVKPAETEIRNDWWRDIFIFQINWRYLRPQCGLNPLSLLIPPNFWFLTSKNLYIDYIIGKPRVLWLQLCCPIKEKIIIEGSFTYRTRKRKKSAIYPLIVQLMWLNQSVLDKNDPFTSIKIRLKSSNKVISPVNNKCDRQ